MAKEAGGIIIIPDPDAAPDVEGLASGSMQSKRNDNERLRARGCDG